MKHKIPKILKSIFLLIFIFQMLGLIILLALPNLSQAANPKPITFTPQVDIPGSNVGGTVGPNSIGEYIKAIYKYAIGIVGIVAAVVLMMGGVIWLTAGGNQTRVGEAKAWIGASLTGLVIALTSYMILATVNPNLVNFKPIDVATVEEIKAYQVGCCEGACDILTNKEDCETKNADNTWKTSNYVFQCNNNTCKETKILAICPDIVVGNPCVNGTNNGYCNAGKCEPCLPIGAKCKQTLFIPGFADNIRCVNEKGSCGNGQAGDCDCPALGDCICK